MGQSLGGAPSSLPAHRVRILEAAPPALHLQAWRNEWLFQTSISLSTKSQGDLPLAAAGREPKGFKSFPHLPFLLEAAQNEMPSHCRAGWHLPVASKQAGKAAAAWGSPAAPGEAGWGQGEKVETTHEKCWKERRRKRVQAPGGLLLGTRGATSSSRGKSHSLRAPGGRGTLSLIPKRRRWAGGAQQSGGSQRRRGMKGRGGGRGIKPASPPREGHTGLSSVLGKGVPLEEEIFLHTVLVWVWQRQPGRFRPS